MLFPVNYAQVQPLSWIRRMPFARDSENCSSDHWPRYYVSECRFASCNTYKSNYGLDHFNSQWGAVGLLATADKESRSKLLHYGFALGCYVPNFSSDCRSACHDYDFVEFTVTHSRDACASLYKSSTAGSQISACSGCSRNDFCVTEGPWKTHLSPQPKCQP